MHAITPTEAEAIRALWCDGLTISEIAEKTGWARGSVYKLTLALRYPNGHKPRVRYSIIARARKAGLGDQGSEARREGHGISYQGDRSDSK